MVEIINDFDEMNLNENLLRGIYGYGYEKPDYLYVEVWVVISHRAYAYFMLEYCREHSVTTFLG